MKCKKRGCDRRAVENGYCRPCLTALWKAVQKLPFWPLHDRGCQCENDCDGVERNKALERVAMAAQLQIDMHKPLECEHSYELRTALADL